MNTPKRRCPTCGRIIDKREIALFKGLVEALWKVYRRCVEKETHEFMMKHIRDLLGQNEYARFGDWVFFGGLVYKHGKANYGLNIERCEAFFWNQLDIPTRVWKDPTTGRLKNAEGYKTMSEIPGIQEFLDEDGMYQAKYKPGVAAEINR